MSAEELQDVFPACEEITEGHLRTIVFRGMHLSLQETRGHVCEADSSSVLETLFHTSQSVDVKSIQTQFNLYYHKDANDTKTKKCKTVSGKSRLLASVCDCADFNIIWKILHELDFSQFLLNIKAG